VDFPTVQICPPKRKKKEERGDSFPFFLTVNLPAKQSRGKIHHFFSFSRQKTEDTKNGVEESEPYQKFVCCIIRMYTINNHDIDVIP